MSPRAIRPKAATPAALIESATAPVESAGSIESAAAPVESAAAPVESAGSIESAAAPVESAAAPVESAGSIELAPSAEQPTPDRAGRPRVRFRVSRWNKRVGKAHLDDFDVGAEPGATVLDALLEIRRRQDPSLVFRYSCMHASCGTCGVRVNDREALACDTKLADLPAGKPVKVEPLANQRLVADLATDLVDFYARLEPAGMPLVRAAEVGDAVEPPESVRAFARFENCIECGLCLSACPVARTGRDYIGPAALAAAARVVDEPRGQELGPVLALAAEPDSVWRCRDAMECTAVCPSAVDPARAILTLRRHIAANGVRRLIRRGATR